MNRFALALTAWATLGLEMGLRVPLRVHIGDVMLAPSPALILATLLAMGTTPAQAAWSCLILGLLVDLLWTLPLPGGQTATIAGPHALGYLVLAQVVLAMRSQLIRKNPLTLAFLVCVGGLVAEVVAAGVMTLRQFYDPIEWHVLGQLAARAGSVAYTALLAWVVGVVVFWVHPITALVEGTGLDFAQGRPWGRRA